MISVSTFFSDTLNTVDAVIGNFVNHAYQHFIQANSGLITLLLTVYVMFIGYRFLNHNHHFGMHQIMRHMITMLIVYGMVMNWNLYNLLVYKLFTNEPGNIAKVLVNSAGQQTGEGLTQALDGIYKAVVDASMGFFGQLSFSAAGMAFLFYGILVYIIGSLMCVFALLLYIYAKMMMAVSLALGPIFILFVLWDSTKGMFAAWLRKLITLALIPIITSAILCLMLSVINVTLPNINQPAENMQFYGIAPFLGLSLATTLILSQVLNICSALGGGITLASLSKATGIAKTALATSGITPAFNKLTGNSARKNISRNKTRSSIPKFSTE
ncbi:MAG: type IV secretion system protein [Gammaproteobacteria bacterium]|nr:type IV secretion system protein [Gammaproteobacteria bacterium]